LLQNSANLRRALQTQFVRLTSEKHAAQRCENLRNSLGLNHKSAALNQLSYAGAIDMKASLAISSRLGHAHNSTRYARKKQRRELVVSVRLQRL
jgi:hypothetical protein